ncbi:hypothetical protein SERLA73DRAFT_181833 [Serpula lacrymans var. lacrymans S7.3]|uniref:Uncharacterized protein n=2 Tax=Serpula lacrymans var. lacrymans TaxID=341189 RepID=F8PYT6_SERL3|nr:uncharacterized protein SERLADRAFT_468211 [Serpula lacrymans var. lacrymans S7.9]EGN99049.1 hypothetical protein SERLA73DRAFT_181833 [Serpula lacrymans var. lacrymans S7.3]EGO24624.1 hypothetical protein SERLADRAFT_468211 [Serpula lacrymans var. lacrymans S7.9]
MRRFQPSPPARQPRSRSREPGARRARSPSPRATMSTFSRSEEQPSSNYRESYRIPTLLAPWEHHADYGLIHPSGCDICSSYMKHCADASYSENQPAFQMALKERKRYNEEIFLNGVVEGRRRQKADEKDLFDDAERYRLERNQAREELVCLRSQLESSQAEYARLEERVKQLETTRASQQSSASASPVPTPAVDQAVASQAPAAVEPSEPVSSSFDIANPMEMPSPATPFDQSSLYDLLANVTSQPSSPPSTTIPTPSGPDLATTRTFATVVSAGQSNPTTANTTPQATTSASPDPAWTIVTPPRVSKPPKSIKQLQSLMKAAHQPANHTALRKVKALCAEAHQTAREQKTDIQRYLLTNWRSPDWENPSAQPTFPAPLNNPRLEDPPERWVEYYAANPSSCPKGIRREADGRPVLSDMKASRTVARLRPPIIPDDPESRQARQDFLTATTRIFSVPGAYETIISRANVSIAPQVTYTPYSSAVVDVTIQGVARHYAVCGVSCLIAENELGPWAREYIKETDI